MDGPPGGGDGDESPGEESEDDTLDQSTLDKQVTLQLPIRFSSILHTMFLFYLMI